MERKRSQCRHQIRMDLPTRTQATQCLCISFARRAKRISQLLLFQRYSSRFSMSMHMSNTSNLPSEQNIQLLPNAPKSCEDAPSPADASPGGEDDPLGRKGSPEEHSQPGYLDGLKLRFLVYELCIVVLLMMLNISVVGTVSFTP